MSVSLTQKVKENILNFKQGVVFTIKDLDFPSEKEKTVVVILSRFNKKGVIKKVSKGKYYRPIKTNKLIFKDEKAFDVESFLQKIMYKNRIQHLYVTGKYLYYNYGIIKTKPKIIQLATSKQKPPLTNKFIKIAYVSKNFNILLYNFKALEFLDMLRYLKTLKLDNYTKLISKLSSILLSMSQNERQSVYKASLEYPPFVRALTGAILENEFPVMDLSKLKNSLNSLSYFKFDIDTFILPNKGNWQIRKVKEKKQLKNNFQHKIIENHIYNENCIDLMQRIPEDYIDMTLTSPPYEDMRKYKGFEFDFKKTAKNLYKITKVGGILVWVVGDKTIKGGESGESFKQALFFIKTGFRLLDTMIFAKHPRGAVGNNKIYWQSFEYMFVFSKGNPKTINLIYDRKNKESRPPDKGTKRMVDGSLKKIERKGYGDYGRRTNIWYYNVGKGHSSKDKIAFQHPGIFPESLAKDHILSWSNEGDLVYDPFMGSGTTAKMAYLNNRKYIGSEISKEYCKIVEERLKDVRM